MLIFSSKLLELRKFLNNSNYFIEGIGSWKYWNLYASFWALNLWNITSYFKEILFVKLLNFSSKLLEFRKFEKFQIISKKESVREKLSKLIKLWIWNSSNYLVRRKGSRNKRRLQANYLSFKSLNSFKFLQRRKRFAKKLRIFSNQFELRIFENLQVLQMTESVSKNIFIKES